MTPARKEPNMETYSGRFAARLRELREKAKMSQAEFASAIDSNQRTVSNWETARCAPPLDAFPTIADAFKTSVRNLMPKE